MFFSHRLKLKKRAQLVLRSLGFPQRGLKTSMAASSVFRPGLFNHKVAIVMGGGTGIGKAISAELLELGE